MRFLIPILTLVLAVFAQTGCTTKPGVTAGPPKAALESTIPTYSSAALNLDAHLPSPEAFRATLFRSQEGTLGGQVYVYRKRLPDPLGVTVLAIGPSRVTTLAASRPEPASKPYLGIQGGTLMLYAKIPSDATALRIGSTVLSESQTQSSTVWLETSLSAVPVRRAFGPPSGDAF